MKKIVFSRHALLKIEILRSHSLIVSEELIEKVIEFPDKIDYGYKERIVVQKEFDSEHVLRVVYEDFPEYVLIITLYPGRKARYEKD